MKNSFLAENMVPKVLIDPVDWNTAAVVGGRIDMKDLEKVTLLIVLNSATSRTAVTVDLDQHTVASAGTPAALSVANKYYHKVGAATVFTKVEPSVAADTYDFTALVGDSKAVIVMEVQSADLTDGYRWLSINSADSGAAGIGSVVAIGHAKLKPAAALAV